MIIVPVCELKVLWKYSSSIGQPLDASGPVSFVLKFKLKANVKERNIFQIRATLKSY